eukprot:1233856-Amphidinium_carterae.1
MHSRLLTICSNGICPAAMSSSIRITALRVNGALLTVVPSTLLSESLLLSHDKTREASAHQMRINAAAMNDKDTWIPQSY